MPNFETTKSSYINFEAAANEAIKLSREVISEKVFMTDLHETWLKNENAAAQSIILRVLTSPERKAFLKSCGSKEKADQYVVECINDNLAVSFEAAVSSTVIQLKGFTFSANQ